MSDLPANLTAPSEAPAGSGRKPPMDMYSDLSPKSVSREPFSFTGSGREYFGIWIVNVLLTIVTLGIYSAWAKVRSTRYFYDNTYVAGASFDYHGTPQAILKGRLIALLMVMLYNFAFEFNLILGLVTGVIFALVARWLIWKSLQFKLFNTSYRGIRFGFRGSMRGMYRAYLMMPLIAVVTLGVGIPYMSQQIKKFQREESRFGNTYFVFTAPVMRFYKIWALMPIIALLAFFIVLTGSFFAFKTGSLQKIGSETGTLVTAGTALMVLPMLLTAAIFRAMMQNLVWCHTRIGNHGFECRLQWARLSWLYLTNLAGIVVTLGLFTPFAKIRLLKYQLEAMSIRCDGSIDDFTASAHAGPDAIGEGTVDLMNIDISL